MPSSGLPIESLLNQKTNELNRKAAACIHNCAKVAMDAGLFIEWLESFVGAWKKTKNPFESANAGITEWDI